MADEVTLRPERILRLAAVYHGVLGGVPALLPHDLLSFLSLEPPRHWLLYYLVAGVLLVMAALLEVAVRRTELCPGILCAVVTLNLVGLLILCFFIHKSSLPMVLFGPAVAAGLWSWLLWGLFPGKEA
ncbi:MAG: hypothetical protein CL928_17600 [Deltaproteobacteria bacterium]|nr:hypothetical protein [Deltaproteobacteria bacterium]